MSLTPLHKLSPPLYHEHTHNYFFCHWQTVPHIRTCHTGCWVAEITESLELTQAVAQNLQNRLPCPRGEVIQPAGHSSHSTSTPEVGCLQQAQHANGQPQPFVTGTLLFPVLRLGIVYELNCICRHCPRPPLHDAWESALNNMCLQRVWFYLRLCCL